MIFLIVIINCTLYSVQCTLYTVKPPPKSGGLQVYVQRRYTPLRITPLYSTLHYTMYSVHCAMNRVQCSRKPVAYTVYSVHCHFYSIQCTLSPVQHLYSLPCRVYYAQSLYAATLYEEAMKVITTIGVTSLVK